jgi:hypothetical protein
MGRLEDREKKTFTPNQIHETDMIKRFENPARVDFLYRRVWCLTPTFGRQV